MAEEIDRTSSDINETQLLRNSKQLLDVLLKDYTTGSNIKWGTDSYTDFGLSFHSDQEITAGLITGWYDGFIRPRADKDKSMQLERQRSKAEVFTPSWIVKLQVDAALEDMKSLPLKEFLQTKWLEITCGEAPYMVNRYDMHTGSVIPLGERAGFMDGKFRRLNQEVEKEKEWIKLALEIYKSSYGYEYQGDSLLLARENLMLTFIDNYFYMFGAFPNDKLILEVSKIVSLNVFQMDGLTYEIPHSNGGESTFGIQLDLFEELDEDRNHITQFATIKNWDSGKILEFRKATEGDDKYMKFDVAIGNPPFNEQYVGGDNNQSKPIYHLFMDSAFKLANKSLLITPAKYLSNTGGTPKKWNRKILNDQHFKIIYYESNASKVFENVQLKGGVAISYYNHSEFFDPIETFIPQEALSSAYKKISAKEGKAYSNIGNWVYSPDSYRLTDVLFSENPHLINRTDKSHRRAVSSNVFERYSEVFFDVVKDEKKFIQIYGRENKEKRTFKYILGKYVVQHPNLHKWKVFIPGASGSGVYGERLGETVIGEPGQGHNQTFVSVGEFPSKYEAEALHKYIKGKFARSLLGIMKKTHNNQSRVTWSKIPLQDFTTKSDIDWSQSIAEIDQQLYKKYELSEEEINFIETNVKEMK